METKLNVLESILNELGVLVLDEKETIEIDGGDHYEIIKGELILVKD